MDDLVQELNAITISCELRKTLVLLRALKAGTVSLDNVTVTGDQWTVAEASPPTEPPEDPLDNPTIIEPPE